MPGILQQNETSKQQHFVRDKHNFFFCLKYWICFKTTNQANTQTHTHTHTHTYINLQTDTNPYTTNTNTGAQQHTPHKTP